MRGASAETGEGGTRPNLLEFLENNIIVFNHTVFSPSFPLPTPEEAGLPMNLQPWWKLVGPKVRGTCSSS